MVNYGLSNKVALITGVNNPQGIGATASLAFAREGAKLVLVYKKVINKFDESKADENGIDKYYKAIAGNVDILESKLKKMNADYIVFESDISNENNVKEIYSASINQYGKIDILVNNAATCDMDGFDTIEKINPWEWRPKGINYKVNYNSHYNGYLKYENRNVKEMNYMFYKNDKINIIK